MCSQARTPPIYAEVATQEGTHLHLEGCVYRRAVQVLVRVREERHAVLEVAGCARSGIANTTLKPYYYMAGRDSGGVHPIRQQAAGHPVTCPNHELTREHITQADVLEADGLPYLIVVRNVNTCNVP
jgi:hypothetical protein